MTGTKINLGCGALPVEGWVNVDMVGIEGVDVVHDLDSFPWPFKDEEASVIRAFDVFEHVNDPLGFVNECWRVLGNGNTLLIHTSHWQTENSYTDPTHKRFCTPRTFDYWIRGTDYHARYGPVYSRGCDFELVDCRVDGQELAFILRKLAKEGT
jgi:SAM-dependent methyltransferase